MVEQLTDEEIHKFRGVFSLFDKEGSGCISAAEMGIAFKTLGKHPSEREITKIINEIEEDGNGEVDFPEFLVMVTRIDEKNESLEQEELIAAFKDFDRDRNGYINASDFRELMTNFGEALTEVEVDEMLSEVEINEEGQINYTEFVEKWLKERSTSSI